MFHSQTTLRFRSWSMSPPPIEEDAPCRPVHPAGAIRQGAIPAVARHGRALQQVGRASRLTAPRVALATPAAFLLVVPLTPGLQRRDHGQSVADSASAR